MPHIPLALLSAAALTPLTSAMTLQEALAEPDPANFIFYEQGPFNRFMHAGIAILLTYFILLAFTVITTLITRLKGFKRKMREPIRKSSFMK
ncbi:unnamed protein product [Dibothriocephalus latus]|uniref:Uncharacterized protein n=1 Tax=Dibothriocephalus latus TaxID=60516 RepID=A0A3P7NU30_DIBLA|nr:unnamed protein product [Dibothriocephalus latus]